MEMPRELHMWDARLKSMWASKKIYNDGSFQLSAEWHRIESRADETQDVKPSKASTQEGLMAQGWEVEKSLNVQDSLMSKASMIAKWRRNEDDYMF